MALDGLTAKANTGAGTDQLAGRNVGGKFVSAVLLVDQFGVEISSANPTLNRDINGEGLADEMCRRIAELTNRIGFISPDTAGRLRVAAETLGTLSTITTLTTLSNQANIGGYAANQQMIALTLGNESALRRNVVIT